MGSSVEALLILNFLLLKVTVDSQVVWPPMSRYGFRIEDTGHMYIVQTPSHIQIQWLHSSGLMILEASKASKTQGHGLCGEEGPSWGRDVLPGPSLVPGRFPRIRICWHSVSGQKRNQQNCLCLGLKLLAGNSSGFPCQLSLQPGLSVSIPDSFLMPDNLSCLHVQRPLCQTLPLLEIIYSRSPTQQSREVALGVSTEPETSRGSEVKWLSDRHMAELL